MNNSEQALHALSEANWSELEKITRAWLIREPKDLTAHAFHMFSLIFSDPPNFEFFDHMDKLIDQRNGMQEVVNRASQFQSHPDYANNHLYHGFLAFGKAITSDTYVPFTTAQDRFPSSAETYCIHGLTAQGSAKLPLFEKAVELNPDMAIALFMLAGLYKNEGRKRESLALVQRIVEISPNCGEAHFILGREALDYNKYSAAKYHFSRVIELQPAGEMVETATHELNTRLKSTSLPNGDLPKIDLNAIPEKSVPKPIRTPRGGGFSQGKIIIISIGAGLLTGGLLFSIFTGVGNSIIAVVVGYLVYYYLSSKYKEGS